MLKFDRKAFKAGVMKVFEPDTSEGAQEGAMKTYILTPQMKGTNMAFDDESYMLAHYGQFFTLVEG